TWCSARPGRRPKRSKPRLPPRARRARPDMKTPRILRAADLPAVYNAAAILESNLESRPDKIALRSLARELTFREAAAEANRVGNALGGLGVRVGDTVGLLCPDSAEWVTSFFGILKRGAVAVCMNTLLTPRDQAYILQDSRARVLVTHHELLPSLDPVRDSLPYLEKVVVVGGGGRPGDLDFAEWIAGASPDFATAPTHRED